MLIAFFAYLQTHKGYIAISIIFSLKFVSYLHFVLD